MGGKVRQLQKEGNLAERCVSSDLISMPRFFVGFIFSVSHRKAAVAKVFTLCTQVKVQIRKIV